MRVAKLEKVHLGHLGELLELDDSTAYDFANPFTFCLLTATTVISLAAESDADFGCRIVTICWIVPI